MAASTKRKAEIISLAKVRPEVARRILEDVTFQYYELVRSMGLAKKEQKLLRDRGLRLLEQMNVERVIYPQKGKGYKALKAMRYPTVKAQYNVQKIKRLLDKKELPSRPILKVVVNEEALTDALERGLVTLKEIRTCAKLEPGWGFRVDSIKSREVVTKGS